MHALQFTAFGPVSGLAYADLPDPAADDAQAVVQVVAASINPSDVKNIEGKMEGTTLPRVPGRDVSGIVLDGPPEWRGQAVWGTGGEIGYSANGSHAERIQLPIASLRKKPANLSFAEAAAVGTTYLAAFLALVEAAQLKPGETLLIVGAGGGVGGAAAQIGRAIGARVVGIDRHALDPRSPNAKALDASVATEGRDAQGAIAAATGGRGGDVVFDTVGGVMFEAALAALAPRGRLVEISATGERRVSFDLIEFYHNESRLFGVDTRKRDAVQSAALLEAMRPQFESGAYAAPHIDRIVPLAEGREAYADMAAGRTRGRLVLAPDVNLAATRG